MKYIQGNLLDLAEQGIFDVIVHGCNCHHAMASGIAGQIANRWPQAKWIDATTPYGVPEKLGKLSSVPIVATKFYEVTQTNREVGKFTLVNAYTQFNPGKDLRIDALRECFRKIKEEFTGKTIAYPKIGAGIAGGNWDEISEIIETELLGEDHYCVEYVPS